jgi:hypothetical protein
VFIDKVLAERSLRFYLTQGDRFHHYLQEKEVFND